MVKNWFDRFRIATDDIDAEMIHQEAVLMNCRICHENCCYSEDGLIRELYHELSMDAVAQLVRNWEGCVEKRERKILRQSHKHKLARIMKEQAETLSELKAEHSEAYFHAR